MSRALAIWLACTCACAAPRVFGAGDDAAVRAVLLAQRDAWNRGDLAGYMAGYARSPDLVFTAGGQVRRGWDETFARYRAKYTSSAEMGHLDFELLSVQPLGADGAIVLGRWRLTDTPNAAGASRTSPSRSRAMRRARGTSCTITRRSTVGARPRRSARTPQRTDADNAAWRTSRRAPRFTRRSS